MRERLFSRKSVGTGVPSSAKNLSGGSQNGAGAVPELCLDRVGTVLQPRWNRAGTMPELHPNRAENVPKPCQNRAIGEREAGPSTAVTDYEKHEILSSIFLYTNFSRAMHAVGSTTTRYTTVHEELERRSPSF